MKALLLLDDNQDMLFILNAFLKTAFDVVAQVSSVADAEQALSQGRFTHLVLDYRIETKTLEPTLLKRWRAAYPSIEYIAIFTGVCLERHYCPDGCDEVFLKPADLHRLLRTVLDLGDRRERGP